MDDHDGDYHDGDYHDGHGHDGNGHDDGDRVEGQAISSKLGQEVAYQVSERQLVKMMRVKVMIRVVVMLVPSIIKYIEYRGMQPLAALLSGCNTLKTRKPK